MKRPLLVLAGLLVTAAANATMMDFNSDVPAGVSLGGSMTWNPTGGGHLYMENWSDDDFIRFSAPTTVNSFQMNREPWQGYQAGPDDWLVTIEAFNGANASLWSTTVDLTAYASWNDWMTVNVDVDGVSSLAFYATGSFNPMNTGFWPSIDNLRVNEPHSGGNVPEPATLGLLGLGLAGLGFARRRRA